MPLVHKVPDDTTILGGDTPPQYGDVPDDGIVVDDVPDNEQEK